MKLAKWHGLGNDYLVVEESALARPLTTEAIVLLCERHRGVGSDGVLLRCDVTGAFPDAVSRMRIFNPDGSESEMCGNGIRIFARYLVATGAVSGSEFVIETLAGPITPRLLEGGAVRVDMGLARFRGVGIHEDLAGATAPDGVVDAVLTASGSRYRYTFVDVGNPHCVIPVDEPAQIDLPRIGGAIERHPLFPNRTNVEFIRAESDGSVSMRVWERGVGETQACGTGATAVGAASVRLGLASSPVRVRLLGGDLLIEVRGTGDAGAADIGLGDGLRVFMTGPAEEVCTCKLSDELLRRLDWPAAAGDV
jgi:diaminopimelate epimerase